MKMNEMGSEAGWASSRRCNDVGMKLSGRDETPPRHRKFPEPCGWEAPSIRSSDDDDDDDCSTCTGSTAQLIRQSRLKYPAKHKQPDVEAEWLELEQLLYAEWNTMQKAFQRQGELLDMYFAFRERYELDAEHLVDAELHQDIVEWDDERWMVLGFREARAMASVARGRRRTCDQHGSSTTASTFTVNSSTD